MANDSKKAATKPPRAIVYFRNRKERKSMLAKIEATKLSVSRFFLVAATEKLQRDGGQ